MNRAVFLDRDGVLNQAIVKNGKPYPPRNTSETVIGTGVLSALTRLKNAGFLLIGVTNQPDVARGQTPIHEVESINAFLLKNLPITEIRVCYHDDCDQCDCRKPLPGLILEAARFWQIDLLSSYMIGDRWRDIEAGQSAKCKTIWLDLGYLEKPPDSDPDFKVTNLTEAANQILNLRKNL